MVVHTGFLIFVRRIDPGGDERAKELMEEQGGMVEREKAGTDMAE